MTREQLESYKSMKAEITELKTKLVDVGHDDDFLCSSVIKDYRSGYPVPQAVIGFDQDKYERFKNRYESKISELENECSDIEKYIENIGDSLTRRIFRMYYLEGRQQEQISKTLHCERSNVSRKITNYLKKTENYF